MIVVVDKRGAAVVTERGRAVQAAANTVLMNGLASSSSACVLQ